MAGIPLDRVNAEDLHRPRTLDIGFIFGLISSAFDALTFWLLLRILHADVGLFRTGWFVESLVTQVLVIFVNRTRGRPWASRPSAMLSAASLAIVAVALVLPYTAVGRLFDFVPLPAAFLAWLAGMVAAYLVLVEAAKRFFPGHLTSRPRRRAPREAQPDARPAR